ncbi:uncharacterized protein MKZ38_007743 [Zalerion maritima]|uniref:Importin N-terminal domain-containing protein n=1 Tax=Zalerion maritima TaxID=339359 RepID=A0AAD5RHU0_9PEZI|nr:uncharacterized protein MKZ38_007743 [Zalerion maritima]
MAWQPSAESLSQLALCLKNSLGSNKELQKEAETMLTQAKSSPDINNYLAYIFTNPESPAGLTFSAEDYHVVRAAAALMLKNNVKSHYKQIPESSLSLIKASVPIGLQDKNAQIRNYAGIIATEVVRKGGLMGWPELLPDLLKFVGNESGQVTDEGQEGAMAALCKICEDNTRLLERDHGGQVPANFLFPKLIQATNSHLHKVRADALSAINVFLSKGSLAAVSSVDGLLERLFVLSNDQSGAVQGQICRIFVNLVEVSADKLVPHIDGLVNYIIREQKSDDEELACEAAEFWLSVGEHMSLWRALGPQHITKIIPVLLESMVYSPEDIALLGGESDDEDEDDRVEDIKPQFAKKPVQRVANGAEGNASAQPGATPGPNVYEKLATIEDDLEEGEIALDDEFGDEDGDGKWNLRKCSAASLDVFARDFRAPVFECILPYLDENLKHAEWPHREAAVLALGAIADGCIDVVRPHLPAIVPYLLSLLNDPEPVVRTITCWTLGRYSSWASELINPADKASYFEPLMEGILHKMLDKNKKVQAAGASAFAHLSEKAGRRLEPYCLPIVRQFDQCFSKYKDRNMYILYDCVQTLAENIGPVLAHPDVVGTLMPALIARWEKVLDESRELIPLLECLSYVAMALNDTFAPYSEPIFRRCVQIIHQNLEQNFAAQNNPGLDHPDKDFLITSLDLISAVIQALDSNKAQQLVQSQQPAFFELVCLTMEDPADEVRQSAYAVLGDCARYVYPQLQPTLGQVFPILTKQLDMDALLDEDIESGFGVVNNTLWSAGEIALQHGKAMEPYVPELKQRCIDIMNHPHVPKSVSENAATALGRLGLECSHLMSDDLGNYAGTWLDAMDEVSSSEEKSTAFKGFSMIVCRNPTVMESSLLHFFTAIARYEDVKLKSPPKIECKETFMNVFNVYRQLIGDFDTFLSKMNPADVQALRTQGYV